MNPNKELCGRKCGHSYCTVCNPRVEALHIRPTAEPCDIHEWPNDGLAARLIDAMRERHGKGGVNVCRSCIERARESLPAAVAR